MEKNIKLDNVQLGLIIVSYNTEKQLADCIDAAQKSIQINKLHGTIYVIDNNSKDKSVAISKSKGVVVTANKVNVGFAAAVNQGLNQATSDKANYFLILNADAIINQKAIISMLEAFMNRSEIGAVGPAMVDDNGKDSTAGYYWKVPSFLSITLFSTVLRPLFIKSNFLVKHIYQETGLENDRAVAQIPGACLLTSLNVLNRVGLLDEDYAIWYEDVDWCYRARKEGYVMWYCANAKVKHVGGVAFEKWQSLDKAVTFYVSMKTFFSKHKPLSGILVRLSLTVNSLVLYLKSRDKSNLVFLKQFWLKKRGQLPE